MIREPPGFFSDWSRHSLSLAIRKRWGTFGVAGRQYKYAEILKMQLTELQQLMMTAGQYRQPECVYWAFEAMSIQLGGEEGRLWLGVLNTMMGLQEAVAVEVVKAILAKYPTDDAVLEQLQLDARSAFVIGKAYSDIAFAAKGHSKSTLQTNKKLALHYLGVARDRCQTEQHQPGVDPYRAAAIAAALAATVASAYEAAAYLQWKGTRTTALAE